MVAHLAVDDHVLFFILCTNSIGSSIVMMCRQRFEIDVVGIIAARVVDLPLPVGPGDDDEALVQMTKLLQRLGQLEVLERHDLRRNLPEHRGLAPMVVEEVAAKPGEAVDLVREVEVVALEDVRSSVSPGRSPSGGCLHLRRLDRVVPDGMERAGNP